MNLKKNDKIIAIAAVIVLIIAGIGIIAYTDTEEKIKTPKEVTQTYGVMHNVMESTATPDNTEYYVASRVIRPDIVYNGTVEIPTDRHVKQITFRVEYTDNIRGFILKNRGADTLTVTIDGTNMAGETKTITGSGNVTFQSNPQSPLILGPIDAEDDFIAREILNENLSEKIMAETYTITASIKHGERPFLMPIKWIREKLGTDSFSLIIEYEYYEYNLGLNINDEEPAGEEETPQESENWGSTVYYSMSYLGRYY
jgi:hypothetical protein